MAKFYYDGDFAVINVAGKDYTLINGKEYDNLPEDNDKIKQFVAQGKLIYVPGARKSEKDGGNE